MIIRWDGNCLVNLNVNHRCSIHWQFFYFIHYISNKREKITGRKRTGFCGTFDMFFFFCYFRQHFYDILLKFHCHRRQNCNLPCLSLAGWNFIVIMTAHRVTWCITHSASDKCGHRSFSWGRITFEMDEQHKTRIKPRRSTNPALSIVKVKLVVLLTWILKGETIVLAIWSSIDSAYWNGAYCNFSSIFGRFNANYWSDYSKKFIVFFSVHWRSFAHKISLSYVHFF